ncbi:PREDICTED: uncharacterized protein LOC108763385 [Trachymyrmex cornetzi]|uniref:Uncharacterized protein n=1 Tax=Trachymyrmex cornetzi TaxID=471704 RepID=A0A151JR34_9HYME|nr:PREDICTED: uncharacterized protein LOC108763385 [Trachymyrmex cornetzi]KYN29531.1 hypothetical protein ALC57_01020 [Trachymyrmex cornetzi]
MEIMNTENTGELHASLSIKHHDSLLSISCNWQISNNKQFVDAVTITPMQYSSARINCEDVASVDTCIALQPMGSNTEPCMLNIKVSNCQKIARIAIISEGNVLEIFKQFGEYETTIHAEFIDEYEENIVFLGETIIHPPTTEISIKFIRTKNKGPLMWIYGIRLFLTDSIKEAKSSAFDNIIQTFLNNASNGKMSQESEMAKRVFDGKQESMRKYREKLLETFAGSKYDEYINKIERSNNKKQFSNCGDNYEQSNATECKNRIERRNSKTEYPNCGENYERSDIKTCIDNKTESIKETKSGIVNDKDFIQTFLSNIFLGKISQQFNITRMFEFYDNRDNNKITNNEQFKQKILETLTSDSDHFKWKNEISKRDNKKECRNCEADHEQLNSFECKNGNIRRSSDENCTNREDNKKSDIDIRIYIDNKFHDIEKRLMERIKEMEASTNQKLDAILERLESRLNVQ